MISCIFSNHNAMKFEVNHKKKNGKTHKYMEVKEYPTKEVLGNQKSKDEIIKYMEINKSKNTIFQNLWDAAKAIIRGTFIAI